LDARESALCAALHEAYINREDLEIVLAQALDKSLDDIAASGPLKHIIFQVVKTAKSEGWLDDLVGAVLADRPGNTSLQAWARSYQLVDLADPGPPTQQQLLDSVYFDLKELRNAIRRAKAVAPSRVLGFGVTYSELVFVNKLCDWLANRLVGETQRKDPLNLKPELAPVSRRLHQVERYRRDLESANVLCLVLVDAAPREYIEEFWGRICQDFGGIGRYFVLVFTGDGNTTFPPGVAVLPPPRFDLEDVANWAEDMISRRGWPPNMADAWTELLCEEALDDGELDVRALYEAMDQSIQAIRFEPDKFRMKLEKRVRHANPASG
jgi:Effector-associated domain 1